MIRRAILSLIALSLVVPVLASADVRVRGHFRSNGAYVQPHYRSSPNHTIGDNFGTKGNINPHTGEVGTRNPGYGTIPSTPFTPYTPFNR